MKTFTKPIVVVSKCLGFAKCRYNGLMISDKFVESLRSFVEFLPICPEVEIGLGVPRNPIRLVSEKGELKLMQPATGSDVTGRMNQFCQTYLDSLTEVEGFILKYKSPSCGIKNVRVYPGIGKVTSTRRGAGFFGGAVLKHFPMVAVEDEGRLNNLRIREHFLMKLFTLARFRNVKSSRVMKNLVHFHTQNKFLLMTYNQRELRELGHIVANPDKKPFNKVIEFYQTHLANALAKAPPFNSAINVLMHVMGYFKRNLTHKEKAFFLDSLQKFREGRIPLSVLTTLLNSWILRFNNDYLMSQLFFKPYPSELVPIDPEKDRDYWE